MKINVYNRQKNLPISKRAVKKIVSAVLVLEEQTCDEVSVHFVTTKNICHLHEEYFNDPSVTDCVSFPIDSENLEGGYQILGEIFVCPQTAIDYAEQHQMDPHQECTLYIVHGLLHLMGHDDQISHAKASMRRAEKKHMNNLKKLNLMLAR